MHATSSRTESPPAWMRYWLWVAGGGVVAVLWSMMCTAPGVPWNAARLAPSFALVRGLPIYALRDSGAHLGWVYGPVFPLWFLPAGLTDQPTVGLMIAMLLNLVAVVVPLWLVFRIVLPPQPGLAPKFTLLATTLLLSNPITASAFYMIHVDVLCVGWALVACVALHARVQRGWRAGFPAAAVALALSVATKQVSVILVPATVVWLWREGHARAIGTWLFWLVTCGGALAVVFFAAFGAEELFFNAWLLFTRMPWRGGWGLLVSNLGDVLLNCWLWLLTGIIGWWWIRRRKMTPPPESARFARLLGWIALLQLPMGLTASLIVDASLNSIHAPLYALIGALVWGGSLLAQAAPEDSSAGWRRLGFLVLLGVVTNFGFSIHRGMVWLPYRGQEKMLATLQENPGKYYYPWNPLVMIIAERRIYPFDEALRYLWMTGLEPPRAAIEAAVPPGRVLIYEVPSQSYFAFNYYGATARAVPIDR